MANRRPQIGGRRDYGRNDRGPKNFGRPGVSPWQGDGPGAALPNLLPLGGGSTEATLALASNLINLLQPRQNPVPSLLDMPIRRDFGPDMGRYDRGYGPNRMGNQGNFRRSGNYNRSGERMNTRKPFRPNDGPRQHNKNAPRKDDSRSKPVNKESEQDQSKDKEGEKSEKKEEENKDGPKTRYDDISRDLLKCHICNKSMWDGRSFENHLNGRAHAIMMQKTAESYALAADTMRQEFKIREMKHNRKTGQQPSRDFYCAMCDLYASEGANHRTTVGHRRLKKFLHPACLSCHKEMPTRIELDEHRLTAEHLRNIQDKEISRPKPEIMEISNLAMEQMYLRENRERKRRDKQQQDDAETKPEASGEDGAEVKKENETEEEAKNGEQKKEEEVVDKENTILDYTDGDDLSEATKEMLPEYNTSRGVGQSFLTEFKCVQCKLCRRLLDSEETAAVHLRTWRHHQQFIRLLQEKNSALKDAPQHDSTKRTMQSEQSGNWKRRKTTPDPNSEDQDDDIKQENGHTEDVEMKAEEQVNNEKQDEIAELAEDEDYKDGLEDWDVNEEASEAREQNEEAEAPTEVQEVPEEKAPEPELEPAKESKPETPSRRGRGTPRARGRGRGKRY